MTPWLETLRRLESLDLAAVVPGQGPVMHDRAYLHRTAELFAGVIGQVQTALERGAVRFEDVRKAVDVDRIGAEYTPGAPLAPGFHDWVDRFSKKAMQEALDGVARAD